MRLAILITNTDRTPFALARPDDGEKFGELINEAEPDWETVPFWAIDGQLPEEPFDGLIITGSPASIHSGAPWIEPLKAYLTDQIEARTPIFAACFGHQLVAELLGGRVGKADHWIHGRTVTKIAALPWAEAQSLSIYASNSEQVLEAPNGAEVIASSPDCPIAGIRTNRILTTQFHPEMRPEFLADLVEENAEALGESVTERARASLSIEADGKELARLIADFFIWATKA